MTGASAQTLLEAKNPATGSCGEISPRLPGLESPELSTRRYREIPADVVTIDGSKFSAGSCDEKPGWFAELARFLSVNKKKQKAAATLHYLTGAPESTCGTWARLENPSEPPARAFRSVLLGPDGVRAFLWVVALAPNSPLAKQVAIWRKATELAAEVNAATAKFNSQSELPFEGRAE